MPRYYCDYCDTYLTHDSPSVRKQHNAGYKHKAGYQQVGAAFHQHLAAFPPGPYRPPIAVPVLPVPGSLPGGIRPPVLARPGVPPAVQTLSVEAMGTDPVWLGLITTGPTLSSYGIGRLGAPEKLLGKRSFRLRLRTFEREIPISGGVTRGFDRKTAYSGVSLMSISVGEDYARIGNLELSRQGWEK
ncbi:hypothetical protein L7F22_045754 [Adiantum nelumboides]|nr:hypothetical protein [Adiantum nelumboides]